MGLVDIYYIMYLNDILIYSKNEEDHLRHLELVLERLYNVGLIANKKKYKFLINNVKYLGFRISANSIYIDIIRIELI